LTLYKHTYGPLGGLFLKDRGTGGPGCYLIHTKDNWFWMDDEKSDAEARNKHAKETNEKK